MQLRMPQPYRPPPHLGICPECEARLDMTDVGRTGQTYINGPVTFHWMCPRCQMTGTMTTSYVRGNTLANRWNDWLMKEQKPYDTELVGKQVQGFRIDLDVVTTPADIQLIWEEQARRSPQTIPKGSHV